MEMEDKEQGHGIGWHEEYGKKNNTQELGPRPIDKNVISSKWVFKNKMNEQGQIVSNKARLVCKRYAEVEGQDFDKSLKKGELSFFLGLCIIQSLEGLFLFQEKYLKEMLKKFQMEDSSLVSKPMVLGCKLSKDDPSPDVD